MNEVKISGRIGRDMELRATSRPGFNVGNFSIAVSKKSKKDPSGFETMWFDITVFGAKADQIAYQAVKGAKCLVSGRLDQQSWLDKQTGASRSKVVILANEVEFEAPAQHQGEPPRSHGEFVSNSSPTMDNIPF